MNNKELKEKINDELVSLIHEGQLHQITLNKIMILIDQANSKKEFDFWLFHAQLIEKSVSLRLIKERLKLSDQDLSKLAEDFLSVEYPTGGDIRQIRIHFNRYLNKRKPGQSTAGQF
jgi:hypothetical protein